VSSHLIYHPKRRVMQFGDRHVHFDAPSGNQDPYVWNPRFLHTFCHATQLNRPSVGDIMFWVGNERFGGFEQLFCDLVFVVDEVCPWVAANRIARNDAMIESNEAYLDHYRWVKWQHRFKSKRRQRLTLKAHETQSFQPQQADGRLIDIVPLLEQRGLALETLRAGLANGTGSKPMPIDDDMARALREDILAAAPVQLRGEEMACIRRVTPGLSSPSPKPKRAGA
jgi:hypothetical protein